MVKVCKYCGDTFKLKPRGRRKYCYKPECEKKAHLDAQYKYQRKKYREKTKMLKIKNMMLPTTMKDNLLYKENKVVEEPKQDKIIYSKEDKTDYKLQLPDTGDIVEVAKQLGTIRFQLIQMIEKEREYVKKHDGFDQDFLHKLENLDSLSEQDVISLVLEEKKNRESRRVYKVKYYLIQTLLEGITIKNPSMLIAKIIQNSKDYKYVPRVIEGLKEDGTLYVQKDSKDDVNAEVQKSNVQEEKI